MKKACLYVDEAFMQFAFCEPCFLALKSELEKRGIEFLTQDKLSEEEAEFIFYFNMPIEIPKYPEKSYVWLAEPPVIFKRNFKRNKFKNFKKIFTWNNYYVSENPEKFIKLNYPQEFLNVDFDLSKKEKFCAIITKNKMSTRKGELFSERLRAIRWFEKHALEDLDLYGKCWDKGAKTRFLNFIYTSCAPKNYKGAMGDKIGGLKKYKFSICYENWENDAGYVTEKIFDAFKSSNVPVYLGEKNIEKYVPQGCFIKKMSYPKLYEFLKTMDDETYLGYLKNIQEFIKSDAAQAFSIKTFVDTIVSEVL